MRISFYIKSDDRGGDSFDFKLRNAIEMQSVFGDRKPNLLIIDEIDGLPPGEGKVVFANTALLLPLYSFHS